MRDIDKNNKDVIDYPVDNSSEVMDTTLNINNKIKAEDFMMNTSSKEGKTIKTRVEDYSRWYLDVISAADLAENSPVRGCMVIKPNGYAIWENIQAVLDLEFKKTGVQNAYFPLFIPQSFLEKEADHIKGFAKECAVVTHHRLKDTGDGIVPDGKLDEPLIIRPTSETIMYHMYAKWIKSHRDLPLLINQWANVVRWEMKTKPFLRTTEFLWQEGHTAHATKREAEERTLQMLNIYKDFCEQYLAIPVIPGHKSEYERFAGADDTLCIEAMMQDGKALQAGTSHMLGQNFAKPFEVNFLNDKGETEFVWQTSWGMSTRIIGALIMVHSDDKGLILPPKIAPRQVVIVPIGGNDEDKKIVSEKVDDIVAILNESDVRVHVDLRDGRPGPKFYDWERKGIPIRIEIGPRDVTANSVVVVRRDTGKKNIVSIEEIDSKIVQLLQVVQDDLYKKALAFRNDNTYDLDTWSEFVTKINKDQLPLPFINSHWCGNVDCEEKIKEETKATIRCIPFNQKSEKGKCIKCGQKSTGRVIFAKAY